ncbi:YidH family protein [Rhodococcus sp. ACT016]|uniref:YidH family protein n=1 Tax=Rhodococcus sp. ACT016 TaxID=3134808 RepID=UPI003D2840AF
MSLRRTLARLDTLGTEPDPRFTLANERTFLAWVRTGLALVAAGVALNEFVVHGLPARTAHLVAILLIASGGMLAVAAAVQWRRVQIALRIGRPLPATLAVPALSLFVACICGTVLVATLTHG